MVHIKESHDILQQFKHQPMKMVIIESRFSAESVKELVRNRKFTLACMRDCFMRGEAPYASHVIYAHTHILDDFIASERALGMHAGFLWGNFGTLTVVYQDMGVSEGMIMGIEHAKSVGREVEYRTLGFIPEVSEEEVLLEEKLIKNQRDLLELIKKEVHPEKSMCLKTIMGE